MTADIEKTHYGLSKSKGYSGSYTLMGTTSHPKNHFFLTASSAIPQRRGTSGQRGGDPNPRLGTTSACWRAPARAYPRCKSASQMESFSPGAPSPS